MLNLTIITLYRRWKAATPGSSECYNLSLSLQHHALLNKDEVLAAMLSGVLSKKEMHSFMTLGGNWGSCTKENNVAWHSFFVSLRSHYDELPKDIQDSLDWYQRTHGW
jgi:hypothetical protein